MKQSQALKIMLDGKSVYLTGPPGAGKTYVLKEYIRRAENSAQQVAVTASTGIAATHIGGTTIHSWSGLGIRDELTASDVEHFQANPRFVKRYNSTDVLVIDEVSMLHGKRLDMLNGLCKLMRQNSTAFGGLQVILVGDLFQLPPVNRYSDDMDFIHTSEAWFELNPTICYLSEQHRQTDDGLLSILEAMRRGEVSDEHQAMLAERIGKKPPHGQSVTRLYAHNVDVETINQRHLSDLMGTIKTYEMITKGSAAKVEQLTKGLLAPTVLDIKIGAEVMFVANDFTAGFVNGTRGQVTGVKGEWPLVKLQNGRVIKVEPHTWTLTEDDRVRAEVVQLPLRLAWAITIHKSQGMSLDAAEIDLSRTFTPGMGYVALSRVRSLNGIYLTGINQVALAMHPEIYEVDDKLQKASEVVALDTEDVADEVAERDDKNILVPDTELFTRLKQWRFQRASSDGVPPYIVAHNSVLELLAARPPQSLRALLMIKGFGPKKVELYGAEIMDVIGVVGGSETESEDTKSSDDRWTSDEDSLLKSLFNDRASLERVSIVLQRSTEAIWKRLSELQSDN